ncbi:uncharacterized protein [Globicephala melas]|uniref:uncharacterized protein isoform X6 n=1 Tax=Globicephala melas TaxID=9731 RepID=UPI00293D9680|nr:uncharacterized protein LOC115850539 isoform X2 [Globicephala melas]
MRWNFEEQHGNEILLLYLVGGENVPACMPTGTTFSRTVKPSVNYAVPPSSTSADIYLNFVELFSSIGERRSCRAPASLPRPEDRRPPKPLAWFGPRGPAAQHSDFCVCVCPHDENIIKVKYHE